MAVAILTCWLSVIAMGVWRSWLYSAAAGEAGTASAIWPATTPIARVDGRPVLLLFAHPRCPCSRASLHGLTRLLQDCGGVVDVHVVLVRPPGAGEGWERAGLWADTEAMQHVARHVDVDGLVAQCFGARTSGQVLLYDPAGRLAFQGGITRARGEEGESDGLLAIQAIVSDGSADLATTPVYGCPLFDAESPDTSASGAGGRQP